MTKIALNRLGRASVAATFVGLMLTFATAHFLKADEAKQKKVFPRYVLIIRHAEKPPDKDNSVHLSPMGKQRADALSKLFKKSSTRPEPFPKPDFIFATHDSKHSHRPRETVNPLAKKLGLRINDSFKNTDRGILDLKKELLGNKRYQGKTVLVCWHHGTLPDLTGALQAKGYPKKWDGKLFNRVWQISYDDKGKTTFTNRPQRLLPEDSKK